MSPSSPVAVEVTGVSKSFRIPIQRAATLKERAVHPLTREQYRELKVLEDITFEVKRGEFFGVVGRNGSGKSTLLKLIASVYGVDGGRIRVAGAIAPVIELGVGFRGQLGARENIVLNGLMMGLTRREAKRRIDPVIEFAELEEYDELKLMNYSTGMRARLAFAVAMHSSPDVLLLDEVLAVGDPPFQARCAETFEKIKRERRSTVILVTHATPHIERFCDRAMLLEEGRIEVLGSPPVVTTQYQQLQSAVAATGAGLARADAPVLPAFKASPTTISAMSLMTSGGRKTKKVGVGKTILVHVSVRASAPVVAPKLGLRITDMSGTLVFQPPGIELEPELDRLNAGERVDVLTRIENKLAPGEYKIIGLIATGDSGEDARVSESRVVEFEVSGDGRVGKGLLSLDYDFRLRAVAKKQRPTRAARRPRG